MRDNTRDELRFIAFLKKSNSDNAQMFEEYRAGLLDAMKSALGDIPLVVEDPSVIAPEVDEFILFDTQG